MAASIMLVSLAFRLQLNLSRRQYRCLFIPKISRLLVCSWKVFSLPTTSLTVSSVPSLHRSYSLMFYVFGLVISVVLIAETSSCVRTLICGHNKGVHHGKKR